MSAYPEAYIDYLIYFHAERDFFECHEVMEEFWKERPGDPLASCYVGLIQVAVGLYHQRRNNLIGASKMLGSALNQLTDEGMAALGIAADLMRSRLKERLAQIASAGTAYEDLDLPLSDPRLEAECVERCAERGLTWRRPSDLADTYLIHKHSLRDRSSVVAERELSRTRKARQRGMEP
ncbi:DUF309 domain-containing protein [Paenibacillus doosanensis]|uniref:DUF309 domain-containing protein n=1 Tax=Paenibacillus konkukensis TaxID=2020716 RepID=A0ABY4RIL5_9BACL|nr:MULTISPECIES: DUF309 domain-containing protein [Paenibacillus]MCS7464432.1 DUF309 domain-containing protein [Paenibacillus doosanensis]UQZ81701.1 hypothetical protein SK3146_00857 [Paenibacillus konkukensis]